MPKFASPAFQRMEDLQKALIHWKSSLEKAEKEAEGYKKTIANMQKELEYLETTN